MDFLVAGRYCSSSSRWLCPTQHVSHHRLHGGDTYKAGALRECFQKHRGSLRKRLNSPEGEPSVYISVIMGCQTNSFETPLATGNVEPHFHRCKSSMFPLFRRLLAFYSWRIISKNKLLQQNLYKNTGICQEQTFQGGIVWWGYVVTHGSPSEHLDAVLLLLQVAVYTGDSLLLRYHFSIIIIIIRATFDLSLVCEGVYECVCLHVQSTPAFMIKNKRNLQKQQLSNFPLG